jgi:hypothetical protein
MCSPAFSPALPVAMFMGPFFVGGLVALSSIRKARKEPTPFNYFMVGTFTIPMALWGFGTFFAMLFLPAACASLAHSPNSLAQALYGILGGAIGFIMIWAISMGPGGSAGLGVWWFRYKHCKRVLGCAEHRPEGMEPPPTGKSGPSGAVLFGSLFGWLGTVALVALYVATSSGF